MGSSSSKYYRDCSSHSYWNYRFLCAICRNDRADVALCISNGANVNYALVTTGGTATPLSIAIRNNHHEVKELLEEHGASWSGTAATCIDADITTGRAVRRSSSSEELLTFRDQDGKCVLHWLAISGNPCATLTTLLHGMPNMNIRGAVNARDKDGRTPLMLAILGGHGRIAAQFCREFAKEIKPLMKDKFGLNALHYAMAMERLITKWGVDTEDNFGNADQDERHMGETMAILRDREDVQRYEKWANEERKIWAGRVDEVCKACGFIAPMIFGSNVLFVAPMNAVLAIFSLVAFSCALSGLLAALMNVAAPSRKDHDVQAASLYLRNIFTISFIMLCISVASLTGAVLTVFNRVHLLQDVNNNNSNKVVVNPIMIKAPVSFALCMFVPIGLTIIACWSSHLVAIRKYGLRSSTTMTSGAPLRGPY